MLGSLLVGIGTRFDPRSCTRSDRRRPHQDVRHGVSIHAPARGATGCPRCDKDLEPVSIHAPARGATLALWHSRRCGGCFDPRSCTRSDLLAGLRRGPGRCFDPRSCTRSDVADGSHRVPIEVKFRSTLLHEERRNVGRVTGDRGLFRSTLLHEERRLVHSPFFLRAKPTCERERRSRPRREPTIRGCDRFISERFQTARCSREPPGDFRHASGSRKRNWTLAPQTISGPPRSAAGFAPTCSTRRCQFAPR